MEETDKNRPDSPFEAASYDLKPFRERRITDRRFMPRGTADRRIVKSSLAEHKLAQDPAMIAT